MKKTITVNLNGRVFTMDEDAYQLLDNYLKNLRIYFRKEEDATEILADFEARIEELLGERLLGGREVINIQDIEDVISLVGNPSDLASEDPIGEDEQRETAFAQTETKKKFFRNPDDKMLGGVCSGIAAYFGWDALPVRIVFILLLFASWFWFSVIYIVLWLIMPLAQTAGDKLQMKGKPITVENIGKAVSAEVEDVKQNNKGCLNGLIEFFVGFLKICLVGLGLIVGLPLLFAGIVAVIALVSTLFGVGSGFFWSDWPEWNVFFEQPTVAIISLLFIILIPIVCVVYSIIAFFGNLKPLHGSIKWGTFVVWIVAFVVFLSSGINVSSWRKYWIEESVEQIIVNDETPADKVISLPLIKSVKLKGRLAANLQIEQRAGDETCLSIYAPDGMIDEIDPVVHGSELILTTKSKYRFRSSDGVVLRLQTPDLNAVEVDGLGNVSIVGAFHADELNFEIDGAGDLQADSLYAKRVNAKTRGAGDMILGGKAGYSSLSITGAGDIKALELASDTVCVKISGAGDVRCNPSLYLDATINGAGDIKYKQEPQNKNTRIFGAGSIGLN